MPRAVVQRRGSRAMYSTLENGIQYFHGMKKAYDVSKHLVKDAKAAYKVIGKAVGSRAVGATRRKSSVPSGPSKSSSKWVGKSQIINVGRFPKTKKVRQTETSKILSLGFEETNEYHGRVEDANAVYIHHTTFVLNATAGVIRNALIRKLFLIAGISIPDRLQVLPLQEPFSGSGFRITYQRIDPHNGGSSYHSYDTVSTDSFQSMCDNFSHFYNYLISVMSADDHTDLGHLFLYQSDRYTAEGAGEFKLAAKMDMNNTSITLVQSSLIKVQNRTAGSGAAGGENPDKSIDRVDSQPLDGRIYDYTNLEPRLKSQKIDPNPLEDALINTASVLGLRLIKGAQLNIALNNEPVPQKWINCNKTTRLSLMPGHMKTSRITHRLSGKFNNIMKKLRLIDTTALSCYGGSGKSQMLMFQEILRTDSANLITIQYECLKKTGCYVSRYSRSTTPFTSNLAVTTINNV